MNNLKLKKPTNHIHWLQIYALYLRAFPPAERKPFRVIRKMFGQGRADVWRIEAEGCFAGFATTVNGGGLVLLDYFAVPARCRGKGIGSAALGELLGLYADKGFFAEIESTRQTGPGQDSREKRKRFYRAAGMEEMNVFSEVFGVKMELLGIRCNLNFEGYRAFYRDHYSPWAAKHIQEDRDVQ